MMNKMNNKEKILIIAMLFNKNYLNINFLELDKKD